MTFGGSRGQLTEAEQVAMAKWIALGELWNDPIRRDHEAEVVVPLQDGIAEVLRAVDRMALACQAARRDCEFGAP